jgi:hypothetical protein
MHIGLLYVISTQNPLYEKFTTTQEINSKIITSTTNSLNYFLKMYIPFNV